MLNILHLEDSPIDAELVASRLTEAGIGAKFVRVETRTEFLAALEQERFDLLFADYSLPSFDGISALQIAREICPEVPFIFVSGALGEELAIETLKGGATDYVLKQRLERLVPAVRRALNEAEQRAERKRLEEELRQQAVELAQADRRKDEFLAMLAHELRNPLTPIRNALELMRRCGSDAPTVERTRSVVERQVGHLARLIDDLLDVSRITRGKIWLRFEWVDLARLVRELVEDARETLEAAGLTLTLELSQAPISVWGDPTRLAQVVGNLLQNAVKFTDRGGEVIVRATPDPARYQAVVTICDTGIGVAPEVLPHLFQPFVQADCSLDRSRGGLGLGLALVKGLVEMHGGDVYAQSAGPGCGAEFTVLLPLACASGLAAPGMPSEERPATRPCRVLVVEDNRDAAETLRDLLELSGHEVAVAYSGPAGMAAAREFSPEVVLCDLGLPGMDGYDVASRLRRDAATASARLIAVSGYGQEEDRLRARAAGFDEHLTKPIDFAELDRLMMASAVSS